MPSPCPSPLSQAIRNTLFSGLLASVCLSLPAQTLAAPAAPVAQQYDIPAGNLDQALTRFASRAGLLLSVDARLTAGKPSLGLHGQFTAAQALNKLLGGSGLRARIDDAGRVHIDKLPQASDTLELNPTAIKAESDKLKDFDTTGSVVTRNLEDLERFRGRSNADMLAGIAGVHTSDGRNGGGLEVNIRGIQGQGRVPIKVDGSQQSLDVYRGYAGTAQRAYIDPDLISSVTVNKGPSLGTSAMGAIGGSVEMQTLGVDDILKPGETTGFRVRGSLSDNSTDDIPKQYLSRPRTDRNDLLHPNDWSRSLAFAHKDDGFDVVAAYAERKNGNYFSGNHGHERYDTAFISNGGGLVDANTVARNYFEGEEVLNSSTHNKSFLLKGTLFRDNGLELGLSYRFLDSSFGEIMPSQIGRTGPSSTSELGEWHKEIENYDEEFWLRADPERYAYCSTIPAPVYNGDDAMWDGSDCFVRTYGEPVYDYTNANRMVQFKPGNIKLHTLTSEFKWRPDDNSWVDLSGHLWATLGRSIMYNNTGFHAPQRGQGYQDEQSEKYRTSLKADLSNLKVGGDLSNTSRFDTRAGNLALTVGGAYLYETIDPTRKPWTDDLLNNRVERDANRHEYSLSSTLEYQPIDDLTFTVGGRYSGYRIRDRNQQAQYDAYPESLPSYPWTPWVTTFTGYAPHTDLSGHGFAPSYSVNYRFNQHLMAYASYNQGLRMPSLFETTMGNWTAVPNYALKPEHMKTFEVGAALKGGDLLFNNDQGAIKLAYFHNTVDNLITRNYRTDPTARPGFTGELKIRNVDSFTTQGFELTTSYDSHWVFADLSYVYNTKAETCDRAFAQALREGGKSETPNCTPGGFQGSYTNTQNPPRYTVNMVLGAKAFEQKLATGIRMIYNSGPMYVLDQSWQVGATTPQQHYLETRVYDYFADFQVSDALKVSFNIYNLTDQYYLDPMSQSMMPAPGRTSSLSASYKF